MCPTELVLTVLTYLTERVLTVLLFRTELVFTPGADDRGETAVTRALQTERHAASTDAGSQTHTYPIHVIHTRTHVCVFIYVYIYMYYTLHTLHTCIHTLIEHTCLQTDSVVKGDGE